MRRLVLSNAAREDLIDVWDYISGHNPDAADRYVRQLQERARQLLPHPELGRRRDEVSPGVRGLVFQNHITSLRLTVSKSFASCTVPAIFRPRSANRFPCPLLKPNGSEQDQSRSQQMKAQDQYFKFIRWEETDRLYVGYCPDLFPWGGVCHGQTEEEAYGALCTLVQQEVEELVHAGKQLPPANTRPMREAIPV